MFIFHRLKINHDSHEFILEFCTVMNRSGKKTAVDLQDSWEKRVCRRREYCAEDTLILQLTMSKIFLD
jgi:hypothetical protein